MFLIWLDQRGVHDEKERDNKRLRDQLAMQGRLAHLATIGSSIIDELNPPLTAVAGYAEALRQLGNRFPQCREVQAIVEPLEDQTRRVGRIAKSLCELIEAEDTTTCPLHIASLIDRSLRLIESERALSAVEILRQDDAALPAVVGNPTQLGQVFDILMLHALYSVADQPPGQRTVQIQAYTQSDRVVIAIACSGSSGRDSDHTPTSQTAASPFDTDGLRLCPAIIETHGGTLGLGTSPQGGRLIRMSLPLTPERPQI